MVHIAICDDDDKSINKLKNTILKVLGDKAFISVYNNPFSMITHIIDEVKGQIDVIIVEVNLKWNGVKVAEIIVEKYPHIKVIFMTNKIDSVKDIFKVNPLYCFVKPLEQKYIIDATNKAIKVIDEEKGNFIRIGNGVGKNKGVTVDTRGIYYIRSDKRQVFFYMRDTKYSAYKKLDELEDALNSNFIRVHQSFIVNMDKILEVKRNNIMLYDGTAIPISRSKSKIVMEKINQYMEVT